MLWRHVLLFVYHVYFIIDKLICQDLKCLSTYYLLLPEKRFTHNLKFVWGWWSQLQQEKKIWKNSCWYNFLILVRHKLHSENFYNIIFIVNQLSFHTKKNNMSEVLLFSKTFIFPFEELSSLTHPSYVSFVNPRRTAVPLWF